ncbi:MFS transporter [Streptomyces antioxidans]|uniref:MFS transporter n=1 Tax=Streptomyces antioxidans TaxID=1507734 RepID=UPI001301B639|nr:MFS transporter [Streptomyces antioxidans]
MAQLITATGKGAFMTCAVLYFTRIVGFSPTQLGMGLSVAGIAGVVAGVPFGHMADQRGARRVSALLVVLTGAVTVAYVFIDSYRLFIVLACAYMLFDRGGQAARQSLMTAVLKDRDLVMARAQLRVTINIGVSIGAAFGAVALQLDSRAAYITIFLLTGISFFVCAAFITRLPRAEPAPTRQSGEPRFAVLRDRPYALVSLINMFLVTHAPLLDVILPLWIALHTGAPRSLAATLIVLNTLTAVALQIRISRRIDTLAGALRAFRMAGLGLAAACVLFALSSGRGTWSAIAVLIPAAALHVYGEMTQSAASWVVSYELAPDTQQGQYQGLFNTGMAVNQTLAPTALTFLLIGWGVPGWLILSCVFLLAGWAMSPVVRWAVRSRPATDPGLAAGTNGHVRRGAEWAPGPQATRQDAGGAGRSAG